MGKPMTDTADLVNALETVSPTGLRARAEMIRKKNLINDSGSTARHLELAAAAIEATQAELVEARNITAMLRDNNRELVAMLDDANNRAEAAETSLAAAKERVKELEGALGPFAEKATAYERRHPRTRHPLRDAEQITHRLGDFRAARAALAQKE